MANNSGNNSGSKGGGKGRTVVISTVRVVKTKKGKR